MHVRKHLLQWLLHPVRQYASPTLQDMATAALERHSPHIAHLAFPFPTSVQLVQPPNNPEN